jgi:pimeloyl-ACP methyl ester carboxylesterase
VFHGTALDTSLLIDHLGSYIFNEPNAPLIEQHLVMGISLGGHAAWQVLLNDPRVTAGVVIIGCPDYMSKFFSSEKNSIAQLYSSSCYF